MTILDDPIILEPGAVLGRLPWRAHSIRPAGGTDLVEWAIETQIELAFDADRADAYSVLTCFNPGLDGRVLEHVENLIRLSGEVADAEMCGRSARFYAAVDDYQGELFTLARLLRGASR